MAEKNKNSEQELEQVKNAETIPEIIEFILHAEWAESVRESMAKGIEISDGVSTDAKRMMEATKKDWDTKSNDGSFVPSHEWSGTKLRFKNPNGTNGAYQDLQGPAGSIENATAKDIKTANGSNVQAYLDDTGWVDVTTLNNQWEWFGGVNKVQYRKIGNRVFLRGIIKNGGIGPNVSVFTLPADFRPKSTNILSTISQPGAMPSRVDVKAGGQVTVESGGNQLLSLDGLSFFLD